MFFSDQVGLEFVPFGWLHILLLVLVIAGGVTIFLLRERIRSSPNERRIAIAMASFALLWELGLYAWKVGNGIWTWDDGLPLGLCGLTLYLAIAAIFFKRFGLFEIGYYWTWGAIASVLFPDIAYSVDRFRFYQFMFGHMFFFFMYLYMIFVYQWYPTWRSWRKSGVTLGIITVILIIAANVTNTNLNFMLEAEDTPLTMFEGGSYLIYLLGTISLSVAIMTVWHLPWMIYHRKQKANG